MKMTDVITALRALKPSLLEASGTENKALDKVLALAKDATNCQTEDGRKAILDKLYPAVLELKNGHYDLDGAVGGVLGVLDSYTRVFDEQKSKAGDDPDQPYLPGIENPDAQEPADGGEGSESASTSGKEEANG